MPLKKHKVQSRWPQSENSLNSRRSIETLKRFQELASKSEEIPWEYIRRYTVGIASLMDKMERHRCLFAELNTFLPLTNQLDDIQGILEEGAEWLLECIEKKIDWYTAMDNLRRYTASFLEETLDSSPILFRGTIPATTQANVEDLFADVEQLGERLYEEIRLKGYDLYNVLIEGPPLL